MITERSIRADMDEEGYTQEEIEDVVEDYWEGKIDSYIADCDFEEAYPW